MGAYPSTWPLILPWLSNIAQVGVYVYSPTLNLLTRLFESQRLNAFWKHLITLHVFGGIVERVSDVSRYLMRFVPWN